MRPGNAWERGNCPKTLRFENRFGPLAWRQTSYTIMGRAFEIRRGAKEKRWGKMSRIFPKLAKSITMAAKEGGPDPDSNASLRTAILNAKAENMPKGYPSMVMYIDVLGPAPRTTGQPHSMLIMQKGQTKYALAHPIQRMWGADSPHGCAAGRPGSVCPLKSRPGSPRCSFCQR